MSNQKNIYDELFEKIGTFKKELEKQANFSEDEKRMIFEKYVERHIGIKTLGDKDTTVNILSKKDDKKNIIPVSTFASLLNKLNVDSHTDIVLLATYYLILNEKCDSVTVKEILEQYKVAYRKPSTNTSVYVGRNLKTGHMMSAGKKESSNSYTITHEGIQHVQELLENAK